MTVTLISALITTVILFNFAESTPTTLCLTNLCTTQSNGSSSCKFIGIIEIRSTYSGRIDLLRDGRTCSNDGVFCVDVVGDTGDLFVTYRSISHYIHHSAAHIETGTWCAYYNGVAYWMDI